MTGRGSDLPEEKGESRAPKAKGKLKSSKATGQSKQPSTKERSSPQKTAKREKKQPKRGTKNNFQQIVKPNRALPSKKSTIIVIPRTIAPATFSLGGHALEERRSAWGISENWLNACAAWCRGNLLKYQRRWLMNQQNRRILVKARQTGFSTMIAVETVLKAAADGTHQLIVSASQRQASEVLKRCAEFSSIVLGFAEPPTEKSVQNGTELRYANGGRILSLPQNPATIRGFTGNVYLDEFAHHRNDRDIYRAIAPAATRGHQVTVLSTPLGKSGMFWDLWDGRTKFADYARFTLNIEEAVKQGMGTNIGELRRTFDEPTFRQEFMCEFQDERVSLFPFELIRSCIGDLYALEGKEELYLGVDVGRRHDLTCIYLLARVGPAEGNNDILMTAGIRILRETGFETQKRAILEAAESANLRAGFLDGTAIGMQLAEELHEHDERFTGIRFDMRTKDRMAVLTRKRFENKTVRIPDDNELIEDIHSIQKVITPSQNAIYMAERNERGHADRFWALALAILAAENSAPDPRIRSM